MQNRHWIRPALWLAAATLLPAQPATYNIRTVAGNFAGLGDNGPANAAFLFNTTAISTDPAGNIYVAELAGRIRRIALNGTITTIAGNPANTAVGDGGPATQALLNVDEGLASDNSGNLYVSEFQGCRIRRINLQNNTIVTVAGNGKCAFSPDGPLSSATLNYPAYLVIDPQGRLVFVESRNDIGGTRIRRIDLAAATITTIAGTATPGLGGNGGPASQAQINSAGGLAEDSLGNLFFTDTTNCLVRSISVATGTLQTIAGTSCGAFSGDGAAATSAHLNGPGGIAVDPAGHLVYEWESGRVRQINLDTHLINTYAGSATPGNSGDGGAANQAQIETSGPLGFDHNGNLLLLENNQLRSINSQGIITTIAGGQSLFTGDGGQATAAGLASPNYAAPDGRGGFAINDVGNGRIRYVSPAGVITTIAGGISTAAGATGDGGLAINASLAFISTDGMAYDNAGNLYFSQSSYSDPNSNSLRKIDTNGMISRIGTTNFAITVGIAFDPTQRFLYVVEANGSRVDKVDVTTGVATTFAGQGAPGTTVAGGFSGDGGPANKAQLLGPSAVAVDAAGNVYIEDGGNGRIRRISPSGDLIRTVAGNGTQAGLPGFPPLSGDNGPATSAAINPFFGVASDAAGNLFIAEGFKIQRVDAASGVITTIAGGSTAGFGGDGGPALTAQISATGVSVDSQGNIFIGDGGNNRVRELTNPNLVAISSVRSAGGFPGIAPNSWVEIKGVNLAPASVGPGGMVWDSAPEFASGRMPTLLANVSVKINGKPAYVYFVSPGQINVLASLDTTPGPVSVVVTNGTLSSGPFTVNEGAAAPSFIPIGGGHYVVATHADGSLVGPASLSAPGYTFTPAKPGETIIFYAFGFGLPSASLVEGSAVQSGALPSLPSIQIGGTQADVKFAGVISPGLYQFNVSVPAAAASGDNTLTARYGGLTTPGANAIPTANMEVFKTACVDNGANRAIIHRSLQFAPCSALRRMEHAE